MTTTAPITTAQIRAGRGLLKWTQATLAHNAAISAVTLNMIENDTVRPRPATLDAIRRALERAGVQLLDEDGVGVGVRFTQPRGRDAERTSPAAVVGAPRKGTDPVNTTRKLGIASALLLSLAPLAARAAPPVDLVQYYRDDPRYGDPRNNDPRYGDPRYNDPRYNRGNNDQGYNNGGYNNRGNDDRRAAPGDFNGRSGANAPGGSYLASCGDARMQGSTLVATCRGRRGERYQTVLDTSRCGRSDIGNDNGTLQCSGARGSSRRAD